MELMFVLSKENLDLATEEVLALSPTKAYEEDGGILLLSTEPFRFERLAYTHVVLEFLFMCARNDLFEHVERFNWQGNYEDNFCVRCYRSHDEEKMNRLLADKIWNRVNDPKVRLKDSHSQFEFYFVGERVYVGKRILKVPKGYGSRRPHLRPGFTPTSMHPKFARALVNLSSVKETGTVYDPFCGTGGILIEASLLGCKIIGNDIDKEMIRKSQKNFKHFHIENYTLMNGDAVEVEAEFDVIVTDPPYGRRSSLHKKEINDLYKNFLDHAYNLLDKGKKVVIVFPGDLTVEHKFKKQKEIKQYIHSTLTRRVEILVK